MSMEYLFHLAVIFSIYAMLGLSLNLVVGYTGLLSTTHAAFYGIGAYVTAILLTTGETGFLASVALGILCALVAAFIVGAVLSKFRGDYYALASIGFGVIAFSVFLNWHGLTRGPLGISGIPRPEVFGIDIASGGSFLILSLLLLALVYGCSHFIVRSPFGRVLKAIREDEGAIQAFGYRTLHYKLIVFVLSAGMAAVAGSLFATYITYIDPSTFTILESIFVLAVIILGGLASLRGSLLGALLLVLLPEVLRFAGFSPELAGQMRELAYGVILIIFMLYRPRGCIGEYTL